MGGSSCWWQTGLSEGAACLARVQEPPPVACLSGKRIGARQLFFSSLREMVQEHLAGVMRSAVLRCTSLWHAQQSWGQMLTGWQTGLP